MFAFKNNNFFLVIIVLLNQCAFAQKQSYNWYFGNNIGLNFNQTPPQILTDGNMNSIEGCASISDINGNLLFYTNGISILNKQHNLMVNGNNILGDLSSTSNTIIVPLPGSDSLYYLFTIGSAAQTSKGFRYSIINMKLQNGLGEVIQKNILITDQTFEKMAAVRHCNKKDVWVTIRKWNTDQYFNYLVTAAGLNSFPLVSSTGLVINGIDNNSLGALKYSADGKKLVAVHSFQNDLVEIMDFDNITGEITNPIRFKANDNIIASAFTGVYGAAFSPDSKLLYISSNNSATESSVLYQFNITTMNAATILASRQIISVNSPWYAGSLQAAADGKIYFAMWKDTALSIIEHPNIYGPGCNFLYNNLFISSAGEPVQFGLPGFISSDLDSQFLPFDFYRTGSCSSLDVNFQLNNTNGVDSVRWNFGDGQESVLLAPVHTYLAQGSYDVTVTIYKNDCGPPSERIMHNVFVSLSSAGVLQADTGLCEIKSYTIQSLTTADQYLWNTGQKTSSIQVNNPGLYWLQIVKDGCVFKDSLQLSLFPSAKVDLGFDTVVCINKPVQLDAGAGFSSYLWNSGSTSRTIDVSLPGNYWVKVSNSSGCYASDTLTTTWGACEVYIPSAFSPNGDGVNETFGLITGISTTVYKMYIYNRYGQVIFSSTDPFERWDGRFRSKPMPLGAYPWMITYKNKDGFIKTEKGTVMLIR